MYVPLLRKNILLRNLESPLLYDIMTEDLWELDKEAFQVLCHFTGTWTVEQIATKLHVEKAEIEELIEDLGEEVVINSKLDVPQDSLDLPKIPQPSLRTVLIHSTLLCNLRCRHCYLGEAKRVFIEEDLFTSVVSQLEQLQGFKVLISGGEPLLHPKIFDMLAKIKKLRLRKMLLTNGTLIDEIVAKQLKNLVHEVQISIDGTDSHNNFRGNKDAFQKAINAIKILREAGMDISVATMVHSQNLKELPELESILKELQVKSWALDVPSRTGEFAAHPELMPSIENAGAALRNYGWGAPFEESHNMYACGAHLCAVMPNGDVSKCGFFGDNPVGNLNQLSLEECWRLIQRDFIWKQEELECASLNCPHLPDCRGGCRFRAYTDTNQLMGLDRVKCAAFEFKPRKEES